MARNVIINCVLDAVKWRQKTSLSGAKVDKKVTKKDDKKVAKETTIVLIISCVFKKDSQLLPCLFAYSLIQKRERVAHYLSVFIIVIIYFDKL